MSTEATNGTALRALTAPEQKAVELRQRNAPEAAIRIETGLSADQVDVAMKRYAEWQQLRGKVTSAVIVRPEQRRTISSLLAWAEGSDVTRARTLAARVHEHLAEIRGLQDQQETRAQAQADIDRLNAELAAAKARLRGASGKPQPLPASSSQQHGAVPSPERKALLDAVRTWAAEQGTPVNPLGRIPRKVMHAYYAAHGGTA